MIFSLSFPDGDKVVTYKYNPDKKSLVRIFLKKYRKEGMDLYTYLEHRFGLGKGVTFNDVEFFVTPKALSDMAQCAEAEQRGCFLLTQDTMQMIIGAKIGARMIDYGNKPGTVYMSDTAISGYVYDIHTFMKSSGVPIPPNKVLFSKMFYVYISIYICYIWYI